MNLPGRTHASGGAKYRYGMNGQELEDEVFEGATSAEYWMYDGRLGRRFENDPITYEEQSPYSCFNNNPIYYADPNGLEGNGDGNKNKGGKKGGDDAVKGKQKGTWTRDKDGTLVYTPAEKDGVAKKKPEAKTDPTNNSGNNLPGDNQNVQKATDFAAGALNAIGHNGSFGIVSLKSPIDFSSSPERRVSFIMGQIAGHLLSLAQAKSEIATGAGLISGGLGEAALLSESLVGSLPGLGAVVLGGIAEGHAATVISFATAGLVQAQLQLKAISTQNGNSNFEPKGGGSGTLNKNSDKPPFAKNAKPGKKEGVKGWFDKKGNFITKGDKPGEWHVQPNKNNKKPLWNGQKPRGRSKQPYWNVKDDGTIHH